MMKYVASCSYGKDSLCMIDVIMEKLKMPLDEIVTIDVWFDEGVSAYYPEVDEFRAKADDIVSQRYGLQIKHLKADLTYVERFYQVRGSRAKPENRGKYYGFPIVRGPWCNSSLKMSVINKYKTSLKESFWYVGYAIDEKKVERQDKIKNCTDLSLYPLAKAGMKEKDCYEWCKANGLLSPVYKNFSRDGCWFCHYQSINQLRYLRENYPDKWEIMLALDQDSPTTFRSHGMTLRDIDERFCLEDGW